MEQTTNNKDVLLTWNAPARPFKKRDKSYFQTIAGLVFLIVMILFFVKEWLLIGVVLALVFVSYVLAAVEPEKLTYPFTTKGVWIGEQFHKFTECTEYWFEEQLGHTLLIIIAPYTTAGRINLVVHNSEKNKLDELLREKLIYREKPLKNVIDGMADWFKQKVPLEDECANQTTNNQAPIA